ncbi:hypothetical protein BYT27DRAFT_7337833 [Phlegmacium glaucopus]|nr:hypothetical protein BYT27DRAFT_7337833 [Phlegmacium glaucopus]
MTFGSWSPTCACRDFWRRLVHQEFTSLPLKIRENILKGLAKRTTPLNIFPLLFAAEHALGKLGVVSLRMERGLNGRWLLFYEELKMGMPLLYTRLVSSILLRPHPMDVNAPLLPATLDVRVQIKQTRLELLKWIGKHWLAIRQECGFDPLERWALKEISDYPIDDLLNPPPQTANLKNHSPKRQLQQRQPVFYDPLQTIHILLKWMRKPSFTSNFHRYYHSSTTSFRDRENGLVASSANSVRSAVQSSSDSYVSAMSSNTLRHSQSNAGVSPAGVVIKETKASGSGDRMVELKD